METNSPPADVQLGHDLSIGRVMEVHEQRLEATGVGEGKALGVGRRNFAVKNFVGVRIHGTAFDGQLGDDVARRGARARHLRESKGEQLQGHCIV